MRKLVLIPNEGTANDVAITPELFTTDPKIIEFMEYVVANNWELNLGCIPSTAYEWASGIHKGLESPDYIQGTGAFAGTGLYDIYNAVYINYPSVKLWMDVEYSTNYMFTGGRSDLTNATGYNTQGQKALMRCVSTATFSVGDTIVISDDAGYEYNTIATINVNGTDFTVGANLSHTYLSSRNAMVAKNWHTPELPFTASDAELQAAFGVSVDWILNNYPNFQGFTTEFMTDNELVWFNDKTKAHNNILMLWWGRVRETDIRYPTTQSFNWHIDNTGMMAYEPFSVEDISPWGVDYYTALAAYSHSVGGLIGFHTNYNGWQNCDTTWIDGKYVPPVSTTPYWDIVDIWHNPCILGNRPIMPKAIQKARIKSAVELLTKITPFDVIEAMFGYQDCPEEDTPTQQLRFYDSLTIISTPSTYYPQTMTKYGYTPDYKNVCGEVTAVPDVFNNTGNEIILLKAKTVGDAGAKTITVSGTGSLGTTVKTYTPTVTSTHATLIGTFPTSTFGSTVTVTYDSTGLKLSVLKGA